MSREERWDYSYDDNGNLTNVIQKVYNGSAYDVSEEWKYKWNPRDQMTQAMKWEGSAASTDNVGASIWTQHDDESIHQFEDR